jgi:hypothetical protein
VSGVNRTMLFVDVAEAMYRCRPKDDIDMTAHKQWVKCVRALAKAALPDDKDARQRFKAACGLDDK